MTLLPKLVLKGINPFLFWFVIFWTIAISSNLIWNIAAKLYTAVDNALIHTKKTFEKDLLVCRWNASHGGLYVPIIEKPPTKTCLSSISEKDITTPSGRKFTMISPRIVLGFSIVHTIIKELYTATIEMESDKGKGSLFRIIMQSKYNSKYDG